MRANRQPQTQEEIIKHLQEEYLSGIDRSGVTIDDPEMIAEDARLWKPVLDPYSLFTTGWPHPPETEVKVELDWLTGVSVVLACKGCPRTYAKAALSRAQPVVGYSSTRHSPSTSFLAHRQVYRDIS